MRHSMMILILLPLLTAGCANTRAANARVEAWSAEVEDARIELLVARLENKSDEEIAAARDAFEASLEELRGAADAQVEAVKADIQANLETGVRTGALAVGVPTPWAEILGTVAAGAAATWVARDRRKRLGKDPLQDPRIATPPVHSVEVPKVATVRQ